MPGWSKLSGCEGQISWKYHERHVYQKYTEYVLFLLSCLYPLTDEMDDRFGNDFADFMDRLLVLDPSLRLTAEEALDHEYFWKDPLPTEPSQYVSSSPPRSKFRDSPRFYEKGCRSTLRPTNSIGGNEMRCSASARRNLKRISKKNTSTKRRDYSLLNDLIRRSSNRVVRTPIRKAIQDRIRISMVDFRRISNSNLIRRRMGMGMGCEWVRI